MSPTATQTITTNPATALDVMVERESPGSYSRYFEAQGKPIQGLTSELFKRGEPRLMVESEDDWVKISYDTANGRAYGLIVDPKEVSVFMDSYDILDGYDPKKKNISREATRRSYLVEIVKTHLKVLDTLPMEVKKKLKGRL